MTVGHTRLLSSSDDNSVQKLTPSNIQSGYGYILNPLKPILSFANTQIGTASQDDIQTLTCEPTANFGRFKLVIEGLTTSFVSYNDSASYIQTRLTAAQITDVVVTGGPINVAPLVFTTTNKAQSNFSVTGSTLEYKPLRWVPSTTPVEYFEVVSSSLYSSTTTWNIQAIWLPSTPTSGTVALGIYMNVYSNPKILPALPYNATAVQFKAAMDASLAVNTMNYDVYGGPWPKPIVVEFKNSLKYQSSRRFFVSTNSLAPSSSPVIAPIGKQVLVTKHSGMGKYIVTRPGYL